MSGMTSWTPNRKVGSGLAFGTALGVISGWAMREFAGVEMPAEIAAAMGAVFNFAVAYFVPSKY